MIMIVKLTYQLISVEELKKRLAELDGEMQRELEELHKLYEVRKMWSLLTVARRNGTQSSLLFLQRKADNRNEKKGILCCLF